MGKNFTTAFTLCLAISALPLACGDDEEDDGSSSKGGKGGSSNTGGNAGSSTGGRGGSAGSGTTGGRGGSGGQGGTTGGSGGSATGGMAGVDGGMGGVDGGMGGEGGQVEPPMTLCEQVCDGPAGDCQATCATDWCPGLNEMPGPTCDPLIEALQTCLVTDDDPASWTCTQGVPQYATQTGACAAEAYAAYMASCIT